MSHDPLVVNTQDGFCWLRRAVTREGRGLYALADTVAGAPDMVLATLADLAEHGLASMVDALPMPVGAGLRTIGVVETELDGVNLALYEEQLDTARLRLALASAQRGRRELRGLVRQMCDALNGYDCPPPGETPMQLVTRVSIAWSEAAARESALLEERHSTNESVSLASERMRADRDRIDELESTNAALRARLAVLEGQRAALAERLRAGQTWQRGRLVSEDVVAQSELREVFGIPLAAPLDGITRQFAPVQALREGACTACGSVPDEWCPDCAACRKGCHGGHDNNPCVHPNAPWAGQRAGVEDPHDGPLAHRYLVPRDLPPLGGAR